MSESLSKLLNLTVNDYPIRLNEKFNEAALRNHKIREIGWFLRRKIKPAQNELVYWSKNCIFTYLTDDYSNNIAPNLDTKSGAMFMYGTSAFLFYQEQTLVKFTFQVIRNRDYAHVLLKEFEQKIVESGIAQFSPIREGTTACEIDTETLILEYPDDLPPIYLARSENRKHGWIHLRFTSIPLLD